MVTLKRYSAPSADSCPVTIECWFKMAEVLHNGQEIREETHSRHVEITKKYDALREKCDIQKETRRNEDEK